MRIENFSGWLHEWDGYPEPMKLDIIEKYIRAITTLLPTRKKYSVNFLNQSGLHSLFVNFDSKGEKFKFIVRVYASEMAITHRTGTPFTNVKRFNASNFMEIAEQLFYEEAKMKIDTSKLRGIVNSEKFGF